ncbi:DUF6708 domain-containing protein [Enterobacter kobei]|uniref:DUF6708 domain-containing protein n=1 Tax=Enterobacter kobei TaxID=208224 RepID=UPI002FD58144
MGKIKRRQKIQAAREQAGRSKLNAPVQNWSGDLPEHAKNCRFPPQLIRVNELNDVWMEIPRYVNFGWGGQWFVLFLTSLPMIGYVFLAFSFFPNIPEFLSLVLGMVFFGSVLLYFYKSLLFEPRGAPVRFNRKRQKVYVYEFQKSIWPWKRWHPVIKVFDWKDIHGEWVMMRGHADWGHRIYCAVCKPGTLEVVDRFILTWTVGGIDEAGGLWSFCRHYMEKMPVPTAPVYRDKPRDWTPFKTVRWPIEVDRESTTAPEAEQTGNDPSRDTGMTAHGQN